MPRQVLVLQGELSTLKPTLDEELRREARRIAWSRHTWEDCVAKLLFWHRFLNERQSNAGVWESTMQARLDLRPGDRGGCGRGGQMDHEREDAAKYHGEVGSTHLLAA